MKKVLILTLFVLLVVNSLADSDDSDICKCGQTSLSYSCCRATDYCTTAFYYHCPEANRVNSSLCTDDTPFCAKCRCGRTMFSYSCCTDKQHCSNGFTMHCSNTNRVGGCDASTPPCNGKNSFLEDETYAEFYQTDENKAQ